MAIFTRATKAAVSPPSEAAKAAAAGSGRGGGGYGYNANNAGVNLVGQYYTYYEGDARNRAMSVPTLARARDLIASVLGATYLCMYNEIWNETDGEMEKVYIAPRSWIKQPDPAIPYSTLMSWTLDDLFFYGRAFWFITSRTADGFPSSFTRLPAATVTTRDQAGPIWYAPSNQVYFQGGQINSDDLVQFISPIEGIVYQSEQAVATALRLEHARYRNATSTIPSGVLQVTGGEPLSAQELGDLAAAFNAARENNQTAALSENLKYEATSMSPSDMLLIDAANFQALEMCRLGNIPPYLAGINIGSYSYTTSKGAREDLYLFAARQYMDCVSQTLSMNNVLPRGTYIEFDIDDYLAEVIAETESPDVEEMPMTQPATTAPSEVMQ
jgi:phage portal protein BeeE